MLISIKEASEGKTSKGDPMLQVTTQDGVKLTCFYPGLFPFLRPNNVAEVQTESNGEYYPKIVSAFKPGVHNRAFPTYEPAILTAMRESNAAATAPAAAPRELTRSPEDKKDASIEAQTATKNITELICAGKIEVTGLAGQLVMAWSIGKLQAALPEAMVSMLIERTKKAEKAAA